MAGIRIERQVPPPGEKPTIGTSIVREKLRMRLKYPISDEMWKWLSAMGWRAIDMRINKRRYIVVPDKVLTKLIHATPEERHLLHARLIKTGSNQRSARTTAGVHERSEEISNTPIYKSNHS
jgi:hypothetical protein